MARRKAKKQNEEEANSKDAEKRGAKKKRGGVCCAAINCSLRKFDHPELSFFRFPSMEPRYASVHNMSLISESILKYTSLLSIMSNLMNVYYKNLLPKI